MTRRLQFLAQHFAIDVLCYAMMDNHLHLFTEIVRMLWMLGQTNKLLANGCLCFPAKKRKRSRKKTKAENASGIDALGVQDAADLSPCLLEANAPSDEAIQDLLKQPEKLAETRVRLSDISWFSEPSTSTFPSFSIVRTKSKARSGKGDFTRRHCWMREAILACSIYVDLNPIRAGIADYYSALPFHFCLERFRAHFAASGSEQKRMSAPIRADLPRPRQDRHFSHRRPLNPIWPWIRFSTPMATEQATTDFWRLDLTQYLKLLE